MIVLDTNVISEVMRPQPSVHVLAWLNQQTSLHLFVTSVSVAEIGYGLRALVDGQRRRILQNRFEQFIAKGFLTPRRNFLPNLMFWLLLLLGLAKNWGLVH